MNALYENRIEALRPILREQELAALLVTHAPNRYYLSGFELADGQCNETSGWLLIQADPNLPDMLYTDPRYEGDAYRHWTRENVHIYTGTRLATIKEHIAGMKIQGDIGVEATVFSLEAYDALSDTLSLKPVTNVVEKLRIIKSEEEIRLMRASCAVNHEVMRRAPSFLVPGRTEAEVAWDIERTFRELGCSGMAFSTIVAVDQNAALPHASPGQTRIPESGLVLVDTGGRLADYCSDQTRTFWVGPESGPGYERYLKTREMVEGAQQSAMAMMRPGVAFAEAYQAARGYFEERGVAEAFTHGLGHGIGLETHEPPSLSRLATGELAPGMVVTVEPGLYYPDWGGVRWEYTVVVTEDGIEPF